MTRPSGVHAPAPTKVATIPTANKIELTVFEVVDCVTDLPSRGLSAESVVRLALPFTLDPEARPHEAISIYLCAEQRTGCGCPRPKHLVLHRRQLHDQEISANDRDPPPTEPEPLGRQGKPSYLR